MQQNNGKGVLSLAEWLIIRAKVQMKWGEKMKNFPLMKS